MCKGVKKNPQYIKWDFFVYNTNPEAIQMFENKINEEPNFIQSIDPDNLIHLSENPSAINILKRYPNIIDWKLLASNPNPEAIEMIKNKTKSDPTFKIDLLQLASNTNPIVMPIIKEKINKIKRKSIKSMYYHVLSRNPAIFKEELSQELGADIIKKEQKTIIKMLILYL